MEYDQVTMALFAIMLVINIGLLAHDSAGVGISVLGGNSLGGSLTYSDLNRSFSTVTQTTNSTCAPADWGCGVVSIFSAAASTVFGGIGLLYGAFTFLANNWQIVVFGFYNLMGTIGDKLGGGAITMLLTTVSGVFYIVAAFGLIFWIKTVASIIRGGGG